MYFKIHSQVLSMTGFSNLDGFLVSLDAKKTNFLSILPWSILKSLK